MTARWTTRWAARWTAIWAACYGLMLLAAVGVLLIMHAALDAPARATFVTLLDASGTLLIAVAILTFAFTGMLAHWLTRTYFTPLLRYAEWIPLIAAGNPAYRITASGPAELNKLAHVINHFADHYQHTLRDVEARVSQSNIGLARERSHLAALMSNLAQSLVVCNADGCVLLYNEQARRLFATPAVTNGGAFLGLGRSLHDLLNRELLTQQYAGLRQRLTQDKTHGETNVFSEFNLPLPCGKTAHARMVPVTHERSDGSNDGDVRCEGYVLLLTETGAPAAPQTTAAEPPLSGRPVYYDFDLFHQPGQTKEIDERPLRELSFTVFDTETTGLEPGAGDEIISIGAVRIVNARLLHGETYQQLVDPRRPLQPDAARIHGITLAMLAGKPSIDQVLPTFHRFCAGTVLVGHNAAFDMRFLELKAQSSGVCFTAPVLDTLLLSAVLHSRTHEHQLDDIATRLGIAVIDRHTALGDAITTARVFLKLLPLLEARGITTLKAARVASAGTAYARIRY